MSATLQTRKPTTIIRRSEERGHFDHGWLKSAHSFSFAGYHDPEWLHFEALRVINDDIVAPGRGFPMHPHADFEIFSYVLDGALEHRDSMGNGSVVEGGGIQYMTAGTGVQHSEFNPSREAPVRLLQIWLVPKVRGAKPRYETLDLSADDKDGKLKLFVSEDGRDGSIETLAPADVYAATLDGEQEIRFDLRAGRSLWLQVARGHLRANGEILREGDAFAMTEAGELTLDEGEAAEVVLFDLRKVS